MNPVRSLLSCKTRTLAPTNQSFREVSCPMEDGIDNATGLMHKVFLKAKRHTAVNLEIHIRIICDIETTSPNSDHTSPSNAKVRAANVGHGDRLG